MSLAGHDHDGTQVIDLAVETSDGEIDVRDPDADLGPVVLEVRDAVVTYDLLINIFNPGTPLHDGAAIVQGRRIAAAAAFLPLTVNPELSRQLGSRHRAAIGVTEDTDALAIVVSEETGKISLVRGGRIRRGLGGAELRAALLQALELPDEPAPRIEARADSGNRERAS